MASTGTDIFQAFDIVNSLQRKFYDNEEETTLMMGTYGSETEVNGSLLERSMVIASENSNEAIPTKAKYEKNVIAHARFVGIKDIYAVPAKMKVTMFIPQIQVDKNLVNNKFIFDKDCPLMIDKFEFHLDYDIIITRNRIRVNEYVYTAIYDMDRKNPLSDVDYPNLPPVGIINSDTGKMLAFTCIIRQVHHEIVPKKIMADNVIENKTLSFEYEDQLASFDVDVVEGDEKYHLTPVYDGTIISGNEKYCEYQDIDSNTIRLKFNRDSYMPRINADVYINIKTTKGSKGTFPYTEDIIVDLKSTKYGYSGMNCMMKPLSDSSYGIDRKTVPELKNMIPKEALSRGSIISTTDLENFFNATNLKDSKIYFYKKKYNQLEHSYHAYLLMKYSNIVVPTNTIDIDIKSTEILSNGKNWYIKPLSTFVYNEDKGILVPDATESEKSPFVYVNPFMISINKNPLVISYFLTIFTTTKYLEFSYVNQSATLQFVAADLIIKRSGFSNVDDYIIDMSIEQNINSDFGLVIKNENESLTYKLKAFLVLYKEDSDEEMYRYSEAKVVGYDEKNYSYDLRFTLTTDNTVTAANLMKITNLQQPGTGLVVDSYINNGMKASVIIFADTESKYGDGGLGDSIVGIEGYSLCNKYGIREGLELFYNYSEMMTSTPTVQQDDKPGNYIFTIDKVPMIRKSYLTDEFRMSSIINEIQIRRQYIEHCLTILEDGFDIDFKFFNTYGPSKRFTLEDGTFINRPNLSVRFKTKLYSNAEKYILDLIKDQIKSTIENLGQISDIHMTNIADTIKSKYNDQLEFFEFIGFNKYGPGETHIYQIQDKVKWDVPEFLNINTLAGDVPDIQITLS